MCEELAKLMEPEMREAKRIAEEEGRKAGMKAGMEQGLQAGMEQGLQAGMDLSIMIINKLRAGKSAEEIANETGAEINAIETIRESLGLD